MLLFFRLFRRCSAFGTNAGRCKKHKMCLSHLRLPDRDVLSPCRHAPCRAFSAGSVSASPARTNSAAEQCPVPAKIIRRMRTNRNPPQTLSAGDVLCFLIRALCSDRLLFCCHGVIRKSLFFEIASGFAGQNRCPSDNGSRRMPVNALCFGLRSFGRQDDGDLDRIRRQRTVPETAKT